MKNNQIGEFNLACDQLFSLKDKKVIEKKAADVSELAIKAFNCALDEEEPLKRFEMVNQVVNNMKMLAYYDSALAAFLLARKKMTNYSLLQQLSDPSKVSFTLNDCELLHQRHRAFKAMRNVAI